jgi:hypothetical protein
LKYPRKHIRESRSANPQSESIDKDGSLSVD